MLVSDRRSPASEKFIKSERKGIKVPSPNQYHKQLVSVRSGLNTQDIGKWIFPVSTIGYFHSKQAEMGSVTLAFNKHIITTMFSLTLMLSFACAFI